MREIGHIPIHLLKDSLVVPYTLTHGIYQLKNGTEGGSCQKGPSKHERPLLAQSDAVEGVEDLFWDERGLSDWPPSESRCSNQ